MTEDLKTKLILLLKSDVKTLIKGIKDIYEPFGQSFQSSEGDLKSFSIDFNLFINLVNEYCLKETNLFSDNFVDIYFDRISFSKDFQNIIEKNEILKERLEPFKKLFAIPFTLIQIASNHNTINTTEISIVRLYYLFFYQVFNDYTLKNIEIKEILDNLLDKWQESLENQTTPVSIRVEMDSIIIQEDLNFNEQFQLILTNHNHIERFNPYRSRTFIPYCLIYKTEIHFKKYDSNESYQRNSNRDSYELFREMDLIKNEIQKFMSTMYLYGIKMTKNFPIIQLPWWYEPNYMFIKKHEKARSKREFPMRNTELKSQVCSEIRKLNTDLINKGFFTENNYPLSWSFMKMGLSDTISLEKIFYAHTLLEFLFSPDDQVNISFNVSLNGASLISNNYTEFSKNLLFLRKMYNIRSTAIHGGDWNSEIEKSIKNLKKHNVDVENIYDFFEKFEIIIKKIVRAILVYNSVQSHVIENLENQKLLDIQGNKLEFLLKLGKEYEPKSQFLLKILFEAFKIAKFLKDDEKLLNCSSKIKEIYAETPSQFVYKTELNLILEELEIIRENNNQKRDLADLLIGSFSKLTHRDSTNKRNDEIKLAITGIDIMRERKELKQGPIIGLIKKHLIDEIQKGVLKDRNNREDLLDYLRTLNLNEFLNNKSKKVD